MNQIINDEEFKRIQDIGNAIGPVLLQAIREGVTEALRTVSKETPQQNLDPDFIDQAVWTEAYNAFISSGLYMFGITPEYIADEALQRFRTRFPK